MSEANEAYHRRTGSAPVVRTDPVMEAIARKLHGIDGVPLAERERMIRRAVRAGAQALREQNDKISSGR